MDRIIEPDDAQLKFSRLLPELVLASKSENRRALIECGGSIVHQIPTDAEEFRSGNTPKEVVLNIAQSKMEAYLSSDKRIESLPALTADTMVLFDGELIGKASNESDARKAIRRFSGKKQVVISASLLYLPRIGIRKIIDTASVIFKTLSDKEIDEYIATGDWIEAAGSYRLQRNGWSIVERIDGDWTTVVGLPMRKLIKTIENSL